MNKSTKPARCGETHSPIQRVVHGGSNPPQVCSSCGIRPRRLLTPSLCTKCYVANRKAKRIYNNKSKSNGYCTMCRAYPATRGHKTCASCRKKRLERYHNAKWTNICPRCGAIKDEFAQLTNSQACSICMTYVTKWRRKNYHAKKCKAGAVKV